MIGFHFKCIQVEELEKFLGESFLKWSKSDFITPLEQAFFGNETKTLKFAPLESILRMRQHAVRYYRKIFSLKLLKISFRY